MSASVPRTPAEVDELLTKIEFGIAMVEASKERQVRMQAAQVELFENIDRARSCMDTLLHIKDDRDLLLCIFGGDCTRIAHLRVLIEGVQVSEEVPKHAQRLQLCLKSCESVEQVIRDMGFGDRLMAAQQTERAGGGGEDDNGLDEVIAPLAEAAMVGEEAYALEQAGNVHEALTKYVACRQSLTTAINVARAAAKFRLTLGKEAIPDSDIEKLEERERQIDQRIRRLNSWEQGDHGDEKPAPAEEHLLADDLEFLKNNRKRKKVIAACAVVGAAGGVALLGPFGIALALGGAVAGGSVAAHAVTKDEGFGERAYRAAETGINGAEKLLEDTGIKSAVNDAKAMAARQAVELNERLKLTEKLEAGREAAVGAATQAAAQAATAAAQLQQGFSDVLQGSLRRVNGTSPAAAPETGAVETAAPETAA